MTASRRELLIAGLGTTALVACRHGAAKASEHDHDDEGEEEEVTPAEDLMREHGVLRRVLLIYGEVARRLHGNEQVPPDALAGGANIVKRFIEEYHEQLEEQHLFPRFEMANQHVELVRVLRAQHAAGRVLTGRIGTGARRLDDAATKTVVLDSIAAFTRMYEPHAAREDTVLFPSIVEVVGEKTYEELGERFEEEEHRRFGERGFAGIVTEVAAIEASLGIADLAAFTPTV